MDTRTTPKNPVKTTETSFLIVEALMEDGPMTLTDLTETMGLAKSTVHRHLSTLERRGFIVRVGDEFKVGLRFLDFGIFARNRLSFYDIGADKAETLAAETGEKVRLITEENGMSVLIYRAMGKHPIQATEHIGNYRHLHQIAAGKALLASMSRERVEEIIDQHGLPPRTEHSITQPEKLFEEFGTIRERGYALNRSESVRNLHAIGAAFHDDDGNPLGALSITGTAHRFTGPYVEEELPNILLSAIEEIEINLKYN